MKISHETPIVMLEESLGFNDYDYALVHLFDIYPEYYNFFKQSLKSGRDVVLDNSVFELGDSYNDVLYARRIVELGSLNPKHFNFIVPDVLFDSEKTIKNFLNFIEKFKNLPGTPIGVAQGKTNNDKIKCISVMRKHTNYIALPFLSHVEKSLSDLCEERIEFVHMLKEEGVLDGLKIHLLGCNLPQEFKFYKDVPEVYSCDTSNPIVHGMFNIRYTENGLNDKLKVKLVDVIDKKNINEDARYNIKMFRKFTE